MISLSERLVLHALFFLREFYNALYEKIIIYLRRGYYDEKFNKNYVFIIKKIDNIIAGSKDALLHIPTLRQ